LTYRLHHSSAFILVVQCPDGHKRGINRLGLSINLINGIPERRVTNDVAGAALDEAMGFEVFEFADGLMAASISLIGALPPYGWTLNRSLPPICTPNFDGTI